MKSAFFATATALKLGMSHSRSEHIARAKSAFISCWDLLKLKDTQRPLTAHLNIKLNQ